MIPPASPSLALSLALAASLATGCGHRVRCPEGESTCFGSCVSLLTDAANCGRCGNAASLLQICRAGSLACAPGTAVCDGACIDLARDPGHCGACDTACGAGESCLADGAGGAACTAACPGDHTVCGGACVSLASDRLHCGTCGNACLAGQTCRAGSCGADLEVACYASGDVRPVTATLEPAGPARLALGSPTALVALGSSLYSGNGFPAGVTAYPLDDRLKAHLTTLSGNDIEGLAAYAGTVLVANAAESAMAILDADGRVLDEVALGGLGEAPNPHGLAVAGTTAYLALYGDGPNGFGGHAQTTGQAIARVDLSTLPACVAGTAARCGSVAGKIDLLSVPGAADGAGYPFPSQVAVRGSKVYVTLANLESADCGGGLAGYCKPAGSGKLAVVDTAAGDAVSVVDLGSGCRNPGAIEIAEDTAWIACGSFTFQQDAPGRVLAVDLSGPSPKVGGAVDTAPAVPGGLAICGGMGYVTDQSSGTVLRFDPATLKVDASTTVCPTVFFAWASDVACPRP